MSSAANPKSEIAPVVVDLGKAKKKDIRSLKLGEGKLLAEVHSVLEELRANDTELANKTLVPVVMLYRKPPKRTATRLLPFGLG
jgi:hypothetical protein